jgi:hypothetical protein
MYARFQDSPYYIDVINRLSTLVIHLDSKSLVAHQSLNLSLVQFFNLASALKKEKLNKRGLAFRKLL